MHTPTTSPKLSQTNSILCSEFKQRALATSTLLNTKENSHKRQIILKSRNSISTVNINNNIIPYTRKGTVLSLEFNARDYGPQAIKNKKKVASLESEEVLRSKPTQQTQTLQSHYSPSPHIPNSYSQLPNPPYQIQASDLSQMQTYTDNRTLHTTCYIDPINIFHKQAEYKREKLKYQFLKIYTHPVNSTPTRRTQMFLSSRLEGKGLTPAPTFTRY